MIGGVLFASGALLTKRGLEISGKAERMTDKKQALAIAAGGLAAAATALRKAYKNNGRNFRELLQQGDSKKQGDQLIAEIEQLLSWEAGPSELSPRGIAELDQLTAELYGPDTKI
jgi:hypothetical protein